MSSESSSARHDTEFDFDGENRLLQFRQITRADGSVETTHVWDAELPTPTFGFEHDKQKRLFALTWSDGRTERFRDKPARHLVVAYLM